MNTNNTTSDISNLDLEPIKVKLMHRESGEGWSQAHANAVEREYRRFLILAKKFPDEQTAPTVDVDTFWHYHILDTMKYALDCKEIFGYFLHHCPYLGLQPGDDDTANQRAGARMRELYEQTFGESYDRQAVPMMSAAAGGMTAYCTFAAKPAYCTFADKTAYCTFTAKPAYCTLTAKPAYCTLSNKTAYCTLSNKTAYCTESSNLGWQALSDHGSRGKVAARRFVPAAI